MAKTNLHTWTRVTRIELSQLSVSIGNASLNALKHWPKNGEGRQIKERTENVNRILEFTHDRRDLAYQMEVIEKATEILDSISSIPFFQSHLSRKRYTARNGTRHTLSSSLKTTTSEVRSFIRKNKPQRVSAAPRKSTLPTLDNVDEPDDVVGQTLRDLAPQQKAGPLQFEFIEGKIRVKAQKAVAKPQDATNVVSARSALAEDASTLIEELRNTNCDYRLIEAIEQVKAVIDSEADIIRLGLLTFTCQNLLGVFSDQISSTSFAKLLGLTTGISAYVAQFKDWQRFTENASEISINEEDVQKIKRIGTNLLPALQDAYQLVDPEVPKSIKLLLEAFSNPNMSRKRAVFAALRTIENLFSVAATHISSMLGAISSGIQSGIKAGTATVIATTLLLAVANAASEIAPSAERILQANWMRKASDLIRETIKEGE